MKILKLFLRFTINSLAICLLGTTCNANTLATTVTAQDSTETPAAAITLSPQADTFYVSTSGNDGNSGDSTHPWKTIQHAVGSVDPGDTIVVLGGTYAGARIENSGSADAWITLKADLDSVVIINQPGPNNKHQSNLEIETWEGSLSVAYWIIEGLEVTGAPNWGIDSRGSEDIKNHHITIRNNRVHHNGISSTSTGIFAAFTDHILVEGNESYNNGEHGIYINNSSDYFTIRGNRLYQNANCGVHLNGDLSMGGDGTLSYGMVENNTIFDNGTGGGAGINMDGVADSVVRNNLLYNNHATGIAIYQIDGAVCSQNNLFLHNTVHMPTDGRWAVLVSNPACTGNQLFNNIFISEHSYRGSINLANGAPATFTSDYNVVMGRFTTDDGETILNLSQWQALDFDLHSFVATASALFVDSTLGNYLLHTNSPAINAASNQNVPNDLRGYPRPCQNGYDIGAYEHCPNAGFIYLPITLR